MLKQLPFGLSWLILAGGCGPAVQATTPASPGGAAPFTSTSTMATAPTADSECDEQKGPCANGPLTKRVAVGNATACAVVAGRVACWGDNSKRVIAAGSKEPRATAVFIPGIEQAVAVQVGRDFGCALTANGRVFCFQGGMAKELELFSGVMDVAIQDHMVVGVKKGGALVAAILSSDARDVVPVAVPRLGDATAVSAGLYHVCVLRASGGVVCWGDPEYTGSGVNAGSLDRGRYEALARAAVNVKGLEDAVQIGVGDTHSCAVTRTKGVACWGLNWSGALGDGSGVDQYEAVIVKDVDNAEVVATGYHHTCVLRTSGSVSCFGENRAGQIGSATFNLKGVAEVQGFKGAVAVAAGDEVSCAALLGGGVMCWGSTSRGRLGNGAVTEHATPQLVKGVSGVEMVSVAPRVSCSADSTRRAMCWGLGHIPEDGEAEFDGTPAAAVGPGEITGMFGSGGVCTIDKAKSVNCSVGEKLKDPPLPLRMDSAIAVFDHGFYGTAILSSGQLMLWKRKYGASKGAEGSVWTRKVASLSGVVGVTPDGDGTCAVLQSGKVSCVDIDPFRLQTSAGSVSAPREVPGVSDAAAIEQGNNILCVLHKTSKVSCFRRNPPPRPPGPKGAAPKDKTPPPIKVEEVEGLTGVVKLSMAGHVRCVVLTDGTVSCWGADNPFGQLGTGDFEARSAPSTVAGLTDVVNVAASPNHVCAFRKNGEVFCWGSGAAGELGQSGVRQTFRPVAVTLPSAP